MRVALIGLPQSGKSTLFAAVTEQSIDPFAAPEARQAVVRVPDERLAFLAELSQPKRVTPATMEFVDVPGASLDDAHGQDMWRRLLPPVREAEALVIVVRDFENPAVPAYRNRIDPKADFALVWDEMVFADLDQVTNRIERIEKALKKPTKTHEAEKRELGVLTRCREALEAGEPLAAALTSEEDRRQVSSFAFLTEKPVVGVRNASGAHAGETADWSVPFVHDVITLDAEIEAEIAALNPEDRGAFQEEMGIEEPARDRLIRTCYNACGLISFLTMGPEEVRAWTVPAGSTAVEAAGRIHSDFARGFIRAETVAFDDLKACVDMKAARAAGRVRKEGKTYVVADGDVMNILANV